MSSPPNLSYLNINIGVICKTIVTTGLLLFFFYSYFFFNHDEFYDRLLGIQVLDRPVVTRVKTELPVVTEVKTGNVSSTPIETTVSPSPTNLSHIGFAVMSSLHSWNKRKPFLEAWWRPNATRGFVLLDKRPTEEFLPWPTTLPPFRVNKDVKKLKVNPISWIQVRMFRSILDMHRYVVKELDGLRWVVMADDDTLLMVDNLVEVLSQYDHNKYVYIGTNSECFQSNVDFSFDMGFGGAGYVLSYPLFKALAAQVDPCIRRYAHFVHAASNMAQNCITDLGVSITIEKGMHQIDLHNDISGLLSAHPPSPFISLHHFETVDPIFPAMDMVGAVRHLMEAAKYDQSRMLQQTICYQRENNRSFSVAWGYSAHVYENLIPRSLLRRPLETFRPWMGIRNLRPPYFMFNTRVPNNDPCEMPHTFFLRSIRKDSQDDILTTYVRAFPRYLPRCWMSGGHSADTLTEVRVLSPANIRKKAGVPECCDVTYRPNRNFAMIKLRSCMKNEVIA